jgi:hypothetical protein
MPKISLSTWCLFLKMDYRQAMQFAVNIPEGYEHTILDGFDRLTRLPQFLFSSRTLMMAPSSIYHPIM